MTAGMMDEGDDGLILAARILIFAWPVVFDSQRVSQA